MFPGEVEDDPVEVIEAGEVEDDPEREDIEDDDDSDDGLNITFYS